MRKPHAFLTAPDPRPIAPRTRIARWLATAGIHFSTVKSVWLQAPVALGMTYSPQESCFDKPFILTVNHTDGTCTDIELVLSVKPSKRPGRT